MRLAPSQKLDKREENGERTVKVLEVGQLDAFPHAQDICRGAEAIHQHPEVSGIQRCDCGSGFGALRCTVRLEGVLDVSPCGDDRREDHQAKREEAHAGDGAAKPKHFAVCDQDNGQVFEDGVDWNGEELKRFAAGVYHPDEEEGDGEP